MTKDEFEAAERNRQFCTKCLQEMLASKERIAELERERDLAWEDRCNQARAEERERCAKAVWEALNEIWSGWTSDPMYDPAHQTATSICMDAADKAIRALGDQKSE